MVLVSRFKRIVAALLLLIGSVVSTSCALMSVEVFHSVTIANYGSSAIRNVTLQYGKEVLHFPNRVPPRGMSTEAGEMNVPTEVVVEWESANGKRQLERVPIHLQGIHPRGLGNLTIRFTDTGIEVYQGVNTHPSSREYRRIHPL
jgi:hypothetical protein